MNLPHHRLRTMDMLYGLEASKDAGTVVPEGEPLSVSSGHE
jgi:hypothetical protein